ncbi:MAG TPA: glycosyltransferase [Chitinophagales bacterium]|nr:glycosyltransferase [Chitinophagales bacterium]
MSKLLHIISFNVPYPPDYGGVMDVFYKIKALHDYGIKIKLHCFEYGRKEAEVLNQLCEAVYYYKREHSFRDFTSSTPYIVKTRKSSELLKNLAADEAPILFEGLHTCYYLDHEDLKNRVKAVRMHNVEWDYYRHLGKNETGMFRRFYFFTESIKLKSFEKILSYADHLLPISKNDFEYLNKKFDNVTELPAFHPNEEVISLPGKGEYILYHGNLAVVENNQAALFLVSKIFNDLDLKLIIAGSDPSDMLVDVVKKNRNVELRINPGEVEMMRLIRNAHINLLPTFQNTGTKLKLLNALFNGRFAVVNSPMIENTGLEELCTVRDNSDEIKQVVKELMEAEFKATDVIRRKEVLLKLYSNGANAEKLITVLFTVSQ